MDGENKNAVDSAGLNQNAESSENNKNVDPEVPIKTVPSNMLKLSSRLVLLRLSASSESAVTDEPGGGGLSGDMNAGSGGEEASSEESASEDLDDEELDQE